MKKIIIFIFFTISILHIAVAGPSNLYTSTIVYTCRNGQIEADALKANSDLSAPQKAAALAELLDPYDATFGFLGLQASDILGEATYSYNCHAYAWHLSEGNATKVWISQYKTNGVANLSTYWSTTYGCFYEVFSEAEADKIFYYMGDHSAVKSSIVGKYESKWGDYPLVIHDPTQVPKGYQGSYRKYYKRIPTISGPTGTCSATATFTVSNAPAGFTWDKSVNLIITSNSGNSITVNGSGNGWVSIKLGATTLVTHYVAMATFAPVFYYIDGPTDVTPSGNSYYYQAYFSGGVPTDYQWSIYGAPSSWYDIMWNGGYTPGNYLFFYGEATYAVYVYGSNPCGSDGGQILVEAYGRRGQTYVVYPNPVSDILTVSTVQQINSNANTVQLLDIRLYDLQGNLMLRKTADNSGDVQLNVSGLPDGNYFLHIYEGLNVKPFMKQIMVKH